MDCDTCPIVQEILSDEIDDAEFLEFTIDNLVELSSYIINGNLNIIIHGDITGLPDVLCGGPARRFVWRVRCGVGFGNTKIFSR